MNDDREPDYGAWAESAAPAAGTEREVLTVRQVNEEIAQTLSDPSGVDEELRSLRAVLAEGS